MNIETIGQFKKFIFYDSLLEVKNSPYLLDEKIQLLLNMVLAFFPIIDESELIEYISFLGFNLNRGEDFNLISTYVTTYVAAGGIMIENRLEYSLVESEDSPTYIEARDNIELKSKFNLMHDDISGKEILE